MTASILLRSRRDRVARDARLFAHAGPDVRAFYWSRRRVFRVAVRLMRAEALPIAQAFPLFMARLGFAEYVR